MRYLFGLLAVVSSAILGTCYAGHHESHHHKHKSHHHSHSSSDEKQEIKELVSWKMASTATGGISVVPASLPSYDDSDWFPIKVPATVMAGLVQNGEFPDLYFSDNLFNVDTTQFDVPWIYRTTFNLDDKPRSTIILQFKGLSYSGDLYVNGSKVASPEGTFRYFEFDITPFVQKGKNAIAIQLSQAIDQPVDLEPLGPPLQTTDIDLNIQWIDWAPQPPDGSMGLWREVFLKTLPQHIDIEFPVVSTQLTNDLKSAQLSISASVTNYASKKFSGTLKAKIEGTDIEVTKHVSLEPGETRLVTFPQVTFKNPDLWWPWQMGEQNMYTLKLSFGEAELKSKFGVRQITSELNEQGYRLYRVNGKAILIRGAGYAQELLLRNTPERLKMDMTYIREIGLNAIRMEGQWAPDQLFDLADELGILMISGIQCCDAWENWINWTPTTANTALESIRSQLRRIRIHPSSLVFWYGSDLLPRRDTTSAIVNNIEQQYINVVNEELWPNAFHGSGFGWSAGIAQDSLPNYSNLIVPDPLTDPLTNELCGTKESGPYAWVPPIFWLGGTHDLTFGISDFGAWSFFEEGGPGQAPLTWESLLQNIPKNQLWISGLDSPLTTPWNNHAGHNLGGFGTLGNFVPSLYARYGNTVGARDFTVRSQAAAYESHRAYFEAFSRNKYSQGLNTTTGFIQWMNDNARPETIWHLYEYNGMPGGSYFGPKKANEGLHAMLSPTDQSIWVINATYKDVSAFTVRARMFSPNGNVVFDETTAPLSINADTSSPIELFLPDPTSLGLTGLYFVELRVNDGPANVYWLNATQQDVIDWAAGPTPDGLPVITSFADLTDLANKALFPPVTLETKLKAKTGKSTVTVKNPTDTIAFFVRLRLLDKLGHDILPILWSDNFVTIFPGESVEVTATYSDIFGKDVTLVVEPYNNLAGFPDP